MDCTVVVHIHCFEWSDHLMLNVLYPPIDKSTSWQKSRKNTNKDFMEMLNKKICFVPSYNKSCVSVILFIQSQSWLFCFNCFGLKFGCSGYLRVLYFSIKHARASFIPSIKLVWKIKTFLCIFYMCIEKNSSYSYVFFQSSK